jgi:hypothetical protein
MKYLILVVGMLLSTMAQAEKIIEIQDSAECMKLQRDATGGSYNMHNTHGGTSFRGTGWKYKDSVIVFDCNPFGFGWSDSGWVFHTRVPQTSAEFEIAKRGSKVYVYTTREWAEDRTRYDQDQRDRARRAEAERNARLSVLTR